MEGFGDGLIFVTIDNKRTPIFYPNVISAQKFRKLKTSMITDFLLNMFDEIIHSINRRDSRPIEVRKHERRSKERQVWPEWTPEIANQKRIEVAARDRYLAQTVFPQTTNANDTVEVRIDGTTSQIENRSKRIKRYIRSRMTLKHTKTSYVKCLYVEEIEELPGILRLSKCLKAGRNTGGFNYTYWYIIATKTLVSVKLIF